ncbi:MAG: hypothetical protein H0X02_12810 [Nitrosomonas sp.]|nr:hypothetical protein [Nitrosomonas sp.]
MSTAILRMLLSGYGIRKPIRADNIIEWAYDPAARRGQDGEFATAFSRFVFDLLFDAYVQRGAGGDRFPPEVEARRAVRN